MKPYQRTLSDGQKNLRGWRVRVAIDGRTPLVTVITHLRGDLWLVEGRGLPKRAKSELTPFRRATVSRKDMTLVSAPPETR